MTPAEMLNLASGLVLALLGAALLALRWAQPSARGFGAFAIGLGGFYVLVGAFPQWAPDGRPLLVLAAALLIGGGLIELMRVFPRPDPRTRSLFVVTLVGALVVSVGVRSLSPAWFVIDGRNSFEVFASWIGNFARTVPPLAALIYFPLLARHFSASDHVAARSVAIFAAGIALFLGGNASYGLRFARGEPQTGALGFLVVLVFIGPTLLWALAARGPHARLYRNTALAHAVVFTAALLIAPFWGELAFPLGRIGGALLLSYAVLRGLIEGLDVKVRFALSKSTIAAIFIAVFFVASETAQQFFGATLGSTYVGIAAAGALVFALAPLQRAAERLAARAVPIDATASEATEQRDERGHEEVYRNALRIALRDRKVTRTEESHLHELAEALDIRPGRAHAMLAEVEAETNARVPADAGGSP